VGSAGRQRDCRGVETDDIQLARTAGIEVLIAIARGRCSAAELHAAGATAVVADLQEFLGVT
jgi:phosphoglycolate phosphatase-like HAD superfamily hydrolase